MALRKVNYIIADDDSAIKCEGLLIGLPVLQHLRVDKKTQLEAKIHSLDGTDCSLLNQEPSNIGKLGRLMTERLNRQREDETRPADDLTRVNYQKARC